MGISSVSYNPLALQTYVRGIPKMTDPTKYVQYQNADNLPEQWALQGWQECLSSPKLGAGTYIDIFA